MEEKDLNEEKKVVEEPNVSENSTENNEAKGETKNIFKQKEIYITAIIGIIIGALIIYLSGVTGVIELNKKVVAKTNAGDLTEHAIYEKIKESFPIENMLQIIDEKILDKKYELTEEQQKEVDEQVQECFQVYSMYYGYTEEQFLSANGFTSKDEFREYMVFDYKRNLAYLDYVKEITPEEDIKKYYDENVYGEINTKHMLVQITDEVTDENAKKMAEEIIKKLDSGEEFDKVAKEYGNKIIFEELGYNGFDSSLASEYVEASKKLENKKYSKEPVKTKFGYHIIYKIDQKDKPSFEESREKILTTIADELEDNDEKIRYKALIKLREKNGVEFKDEKYKKEYKEYCETYGN